MNLIETFGNRTQGFPWFPLWVCCGIAVAIALLVTMLHPMLMHPVGGPPAAIWGDTTVALGPVRHNLFIDSSAGLVLLSALALIGLRFRSYRRSSGLAQQIELARSVQRDLVPSAEWPVEGFDVAGDYVSAAGIGDDFYDAFSLYGERPAFVLGDVAGKGAPATVLMGVLHGAVRSASWTESGLHHCEATQAINRLLCERAVPNRFPSMFWSYFDPLSQHLKFINAGHCAPLLAKRGKRSPILQLRTGGPALGVLSGAEFEQGSVRLDTGDCLVLYSDGIVQATNTTGEEFGEGRLMAVVRAHAEQSVEAIRDAILKAVNAFAADELPNPNDDRTLVIATYSGLASKALVPAA